MRETRQKEGTKDHFGNWDQIIDFSRSQSLRDTEPWDSDSSRGVSGRGRLAGVSWSEIVVEYQAFLLPATVHLCESKTNSPEQSSL